MEILIETLKERFGDSLKLNSPVRELELEEMNEVLAEAEMETMTSSLLELPEDYLELLSITNGFSFNGAKFYGAKKLANETFNKLEQDVDDVFSSYIFIGEKGNETYVYDVEENSYHVLDELDEISCSFDSLQELIRILFEENRF